MMLVRVYTYQSIKGPGTKAGAYTYVLECEINHHIATLTKTGKLEPMSENMAELTVILESLGRITKDCEVIILCESTYIETGVNKWLEGWKKNSWRTAKGNEVANATLWQQFSEYIDKYNIQVFTHQQHEYKNWILNETEKELKK